LLCPAFFLCGCGITIYGNFVAWCCNCHML
jgi:hypothetical protein